jgi:hypothetical protein
MHSAGQENLITFWSHKLPLDSVATLHIPQSATRFLQTRVNVYCYLLLCLLHFFPFHSSFSIKILNIYLFFLTRVIPSHLIVILSSYEVDRYKS